MVTYFSYLFKDSAYRQSLSVFLPALIFSVSHFYHGLKNIIKIFILSTFFGYIYIQSGSLVIVMLLHFLANVIGGLLSVKYIKMKWINMTEFWVSDSPYPCDVRERRLANSSIHFRSFAHFAKAKTQLSPWSSVSRLTEMPHTTNKGFSPLLKGHYVYKRDYIIFFRTPGIWMIVVAAARIYSVDHTII